MLVTIYAILYLDVAFCLIYKCYVCNYNAGNCGLVSFAAFHVTG